MGRVWGLPVRTLTPACPQDARSLALPPPRPCAGRVPRRLARVQLMPTTSTSAPGVGPTPRGGIGAPGADLCTFCAAGPFEAVKTTLQFRWTECNACCLQCLLRPESHRNDERTDTKPTRRRCQSQVTASSGRTNPGGPTPGRPVHAGADRSQRICAPRRLGRLGRRRHQSHLAATRSAAHAPGDT